MEDIVGKTTLHDMFLNLRHPVVDSTEGSDQQRRFGVANMRQATDEVWIWYHSPPFASLIKR